MGVKGLRVGWFRGSVGGVLICEAKTTEIGGQGVRRRNGACCQQKLLSEMCRQETCIFVSKYLEEGLDGRAFPTIVCF
jgi:hypothetical protein